MAISESDLLRAYLGEKIPEGGQDTDTFFTDEEITEMLSRLANVLLAASEGWLRKAADAAGLIDISESGADRNLSQKSKSYLAMAEAFAKKGGSDIAAIQAGYRVKARAMDLDDSTDTAVEGTPFSGYSYHNNTRPYPLKRFPAVMG